MVETLSVQKPAFSLNEPWAFPLFLDLAFAVLASVACWLAVLEAWHDQEAKVKEILTQALTAVLATAVAVGAWYVLSLLVLPPQG